jgi:hypothetical protein
VADQDAGAGATTAAHHNIPTAAASRRLTQEAAACPPPPTDPAASIVSLGEAFKALRLKVPEGEALDVASAREVRSAIGGANGTAYVSPSLTQQPGGAAAGGAAPAGVRAAVANAASLQAAANAKADVAGDMPKALLSQPACLGVARVTKVTCYTDTRTLNIASFSYVSSVGADGQACAACPSCRKEEVVMAIGEYITVMAAYNSQNGIFVVGLLFITNTGRYLTCGDPNALTSGVVSWGPKTDAGGPVGYHPLLAVSSVTAVCGMSATAPYLQEVFSACFSFREWALGGGGGEGAHACSLQH